MSGGPQKGMSQDYNQKEPRVGEKEYGEKGSLEGSNAVVALLVMFLSVGVAYLSVGMPRPGGWSSAPGLLPLFISVTMFWMAVALLVSSIKKGGLLAIRKYSKEASFVRFLTGNRRALSVMAGTGVYIFVLLNVMPFEPASTLYLGSIFYLFWKGKLVWKIVSSLTVPLVISLLFRTTFDLIIPGGSVFDILGILR